MSYRKGGKDWDLRKWLDHVMNGNLSHADVVGRLVVEQDAAKTRAEQAEALLEKLRVPCAGLIDYRNRNTLNFQLEKADGFLREISIALSEIPQNTEAYQTKQGLFDALFAKSLVYEKKYSGMTNKELADALIAGPWADTPLFSDRSALLEEITERLRWDSDALRATLKEIEAIMDEF